MASLIIKYGMNEYMSRNEANNFCMKPLKIYQPVFKTDLSQVKKVDRVRNITAEQSRKANKRNRKTIYKDGDYNPHLASNWKV